MSKFLVSVTSVNEAMLAMECGADIIDIKNPAQGALGALPLSEIKNIVRAVNGNRLTSATIGDLELKPELLMCSTAHTASSGVDIVKVGFFGLDNHSECIRAMKPLAARGVHIVAVLFADQEPDFGLLADLQEAGFYGVMLDTAKKDGGSLLDYILLEDLQWFVKTAQQRKLKSGLAGCLRLEHVPTLQSLNPDYLGFRSALCTNFERKAELSSHKVIELYQLLHKSNKLVLKVAYGRT
jgi:(5-formylfuran-3-yl)methyl phosphate synthase